MIIKADKVNIVTPAVPAKPIVVEEPVEVIEEELEVLDEELKEVSWEEIKSLLED